MAGAASAAMGVPRGARMPEAAVGRGLAEIEEVAVAAGGDKQCNALLDGRHGLAGERAAAGKHGEARVGVQHRQIRHEAGEGGGKTASGGVSARSVNAAAW